MRWPVEMLVVTYNTSWCGTMIHGQVIRKPATLEWNPQKKRKFCALTPMASQGVPRDQRTRKEITLCSIFSYYFTIAMHHQIDFLLLYNKLPRINSSKQCKYFSKQFCRSAAKAGSIGFSA